MILQSFTLFNDFLVCSLLYVLWFIGLGSRLYSVRVSGSSQRVDLHQADQAEGGAGTDWPCWHLTALSQEEDNTGQPPSAVAQREKEIKLSRVSLIIVGGESRHWTILPASGWSWVCLQCSSRATVSSGSLTCTSSSSPTLRDTSGHTGYVSNIQEYLNVLELFRCHQ